MKKYKVILSDKEFGREMDVVFCGSMQACLLVMDKKKYELVDDDHFETRDHKFLVSIVKDNED